MADFFIFWQTGAALAAKKCVVYWDIPETIYANRALRAPDSATEAPAREEDLAENVGKHGNIIKWLLIAWVYDFKRE
jgi:hypothetical protein